jgi:hypothetical protein
VVKSAFSFHRENTPWLWHLNDENQQLLMRQSDSIWMDSQCKYQNAMIFDDQTDHFITLIELLSKQGIALTGFRNEMATHDLTSF